MAMWNVVRVTLVLGANIPVVAGYRYADGAVSRTEQGSGSADIAYTTVLFRQPGPVDPTLRLRVEVFGPRQGTTLRIPTFPAPYADYNPIAGDVPEVIRGGIARVPGGRDVARRFAERDNFLGDIDWLDGELVASDASFFQAEAVVPHGPRGESHDAAARLSR